MQMQKWTVEGADKESGEERTITVEAASQADAEALAAGRGILVAEVSQVPRTSAAKLLARMVDDRAASGSLPFLRAGPQEDIPLSPPADAEVAGEKPVPVYPGLRIGGKILISFAILHYIVAVASLGGAIALLVRNGGTDYGRPAILLAAALASCLLGGLLHALSAACAALHDIAQNSFARR